MGTVSLLIARPRPESGFSARGDSVGWPSSGCRDPQLEAAWPGLGPSPSMALMAGRGSCARPDPEVPTCTPDSAGKRPGPGAGDTEGPRFPMRPGDGPPRKQPGEIPASRFGRESPGTARGPGSSGPHRARFRRCRATRACTSLASTPIVSAVDAESGPSASDGTFAARARLGPTRLSELAIAVATKV